VAEIHTQNHLEAPLKPSAGMISGRKAPGYLTNDRLFGRGPKSTH
jgi:hypothetical protein